MYHPYDKTPITFKCYQPLSAELEAQYFAYLSQKMEEDLHFIERKRAHHFALKTTIAQNISELYEDPTCLEHMESAISQLSEDNPRKKRLHQAVFRLKHPHLAHLVRRQMTKEEVFSLKARVPLALLLPTPPARTAPSRETYHCPFHQEKTPSFVVYTDDNHYHCFGCQESGDALTYLQKIKHLTFPEALEELQRYA